jgi:hypothetical protein
MYTHEDCAMLMYDSIGLYAGGLLVIEGERRRVPFYWKVEGLDLEGAFY